MAENKPRLTDDELEMIDRYAREDAKRDATRASRIRRLVEEIRRERAPWASTDDPKSYERGQRGEAKE